MIPAHENNSAREPHIFVIVSGKGGVGKTNTAANLAVLLSTSGKRVLLCDADFGLANVDVLLGLSPLKTIRDVIEERCNLSEAMLRGPAGITILTACSGYTDMAELDASKMDWLLDELKKVAADYDFVLIDAPTGIATNMQRVIELADEAILLTTPEPTAVMDAYAVLKVLSTRAPDLPVKLAVNMISSMDAGERIAAGIDEVASKFLNRRIETVAQMPFDPNVQLAVRRQIPYALNFPGCPASRSLRLMCQRLLNGMREPVLSTVSRFSATLNRSTSWPGPFNG